MIPTRSTLTHDADGNLTEDGTWTYTYDGENRLQKMSRSGQTLTFTYDYLGRRIRKVVTGTDAKDVKYLWSGWQLAAELGSDGVTVNRTFIWGADFSDGRGQAGGAGSLLAQIDGSTVTYAVPDVLGNIVGYADASGTIVAAREFTPFGRVLYAKSASADYPIGYSGQYTDAETGLVYYGLRYYSPRLGRFVNRDPIEEAGGNNLYAFVGNSPTNGWDVRGLYTKACTTIMILIDDGGGQYHFEPREDCEPMGSNDRVNPASSWMEEFTLDNWFPHWVNVPTAVSGGSFDPPVLPTVSLRPPTIKLPAIAPNKPQRSKDDCFVYDTVDAQGNVTGTVTTPTTADGSGKAMEGQPMFVPPQADIYANIESARWMNPIGFYNSVKTGGVWDYKQTDFAYMPYGNYHFGVVGRANGWGSLDLQIGGGQVSRDTEFGKGRKLSTGFPVAPYGDSWFDNAAIKAGASFYNENYTSSLFTGFASQKQGATRLVKRPCNDAEFAAFQAAPTSG